MISGHVLILPDQLDRSLRPLIHNHRYIRFSSIQDLEDTVCSSNAPSQGPSHDVFFCSMVAQLVM
jgi:hypothetical protein